MTSDCLAGEPAALGIDIASLLCHPEAEKTLLGFNRHRRQDCA
jgi:hypothetical protein